MGSAPRGVASIHMLTMSPVSIAPDLAFTAWLDIAVLAGRKRPTKMQATWMYVNFFEILSALVR